jgi:uncharacterized protein YycO
MIVRGTRSAVVMIAALAAAAIGDTARTATPLQVQDGDIVFHTSRSRQSLAIQRATRSRYSHMGVVLFRGGQPYVFEAIATVRYTPLERWVARGEGGHVVVKRLKNAREVLTPNAVAALRRSAARYEGRPYDLRFEWSDDSIYCSELVWKMYREALGLEIGPRQKRRDFDLDDPVAQALARQRYKSHRPSLDEPVVSPGAMFDAPRLETVAER